MKLLKLVTAKLLAPPGVQHAQALAWMKEFGGLMEYARNNQVTVSINI